MRAQAMGDDLIDLTASTTSQIKAKAAETKAKAADAIDARR